MMLLQVYEGLVYMDFNKQLMDKQGYGTDFEILISLYGIQHIFEIRYQWYTARHSWKCVFFSQDTME